MTTAVNTAKATLPFTWHYNRMLTNIALDGHGPFVMIFDPAGNSAITPETQALLELKSQGPALGEPQLGHGKPPNTVHLKSVQFGSITLSDKQFAVVNFAPIRRAFHFAHLDGVIGREVLTEYRVRIDFDAQTIQLLDNDAPRPAGGQVLNFELIHQSPVIVGRINNHPAKLLIDTGDRSNLTLFRKFAANSKIQDLFNAREKIITGMGVGGPIPGKIASLQKVDLGPLEVSDVLARLPMTHRGYYFAPDISASVGMGLLKEFNMEFDFRRQQLVLDRRAAYREESTFVPVPRRLR